ncbi:MAG TPA: hypothetical protein PKA63_13525 [Oligoflexia bacterium]|nr:hypothetical protein [Oligoflexia bacterium]HMP49682.1 hypothetical protein [Oligoflexia bacterium]
MDKAERELIKKIVPLNKNLKKLYYQHIKLEKEVEHLEQYARYSPAIAIKHSELKKKKLKGKEAIMDILRNPVSMVV